LVTFLNGSQVPLRPKGFIWNFKVSCAVAAFESLFTFLFLWQSGRKLPWLGTQTADPRPGLQWQEFFFVVIDVRKKTSYLSCSKPLCLKFDWLHSDLWDSFKSQVTYSLMSNYRFPTPFYSNPRSSYHIVDNIT